MKRQYPIANLVYDYLFPHPTPSDPQDFSQFLIRFLILEVRVETHRFYGNLDTTEAKYPGLNYAYGPHRRRLGRFPHHNRLFRAFDALGLTAYEIGELCKWEGTLWARQRYEREEGIQVEDTTGNEIPRWVRTGLTCKSVRRRRSREERGAAATGRGLSPRDAHHHHYHNVSSRCFGESRSGDQPEKMEEDADFDSNGTGGRKRRRVSTDVEMLEDNGSGDGIKVKTEIAVEILNVYRPNRRDISYIPQYPSRRGSLIGTNHQTIPFYSSATNSNNNNNNNNNTQNQFFGTATTNEFTARRLSMTDQIRSPPLPPQHTTILPPTTTFSYLPSIRTDLSLPMSNIAECSLSSQNGDGNNEVQASMSGTNSPPLLTMDEEETASEAGSAMTADDIPTPIEPLAASLSESLGMMSSAEVASIGLDQGDELACSRMLLQASGHGQRHHQGQPPTSAPREGLASAMVLMGSPPTLVAVAVDGMVGEEGLKDGQGGLVGHDGDAEML